MPLIARITSIAADLVILLVAWYTTYNTRKAARGSDLKAPLTTLLVRDGTFYFVILLILNIFTMFQNSSSIILNNVPLLLQPMTMIIVYRFILNLRLIDSREEYDTSARYSTVRFMNSAMMVGNMAEPLHVNDDPQEDYGGPSAVEEPSQSEEIATNTSS
ncbi:hypothetical protein BDW22DRAFT_818748 [Trametopsis cervina]|nr:hypothetical protein BDW22DRAFT_818748 [Trametopsis cervina]